MSLALNQKLLVRSSLQHVRRQGFAHSQWETLLQCNAVSHWLGANLESSLEAEAGCCFPRCCGWIFMWVCLDVCMSRVVSECLKGSHALMNGLVGRHWEAVVREICNLVWMERCGGRCVDTWGLSDWNWNQKNWIWICLTSKINIIIEISQSWDAWDLFANINWC